METFSALLALFVGEFPAQRPVTRSFDVFFGDLRRHRAYYDVTVMFLKPEAFCPLIE